MELKTHPKTVKYLRRIRFWLRELSRVHFTSATIAGAPFLNPTLVDALFPNEDIFLSLGDVEIHSHLDCMLPGIAALTRIGVLNCDPHHLTDGIKTLFNELLLKSKHGVGKLEFSYSIVNMTMIDIIKVS
jgi:hypothetical protein